jgi:hypothetical protein
MAAAFAEEEEELQLEKLLKAMKGKAAKSEKAQVDAAKQEFKRKIQAVHASSLQKITSAKALQLSHAKASHDKLRADLRAARHSLHCTTLACLIARPCLAARQANNHPQMISNRRGHVLCSARRLLAGSGRNAQGRANSRRAAAEASQGSSGAANVRTRINCLAGIICA